MGDTYLTKANIILDFIRFLLAFIDWIFYSLLSVIYQIFFNVSSAEIFSGETIMNFFGRIQLILGVFMLFQLTLTILKGVMDPDSFTDAKSGIGNIAQRVAVSLVLLACIIPINIPNPANEFEKQINNNGLLFGTLYSLQHRIIQNNTLGRLILGTTDDETANYLTGNDKDQLRQAANLFTTTILRGFIKINLKPDEERVHIEGKEDEMIAENRICSASKFDKFIDIYTDLDSSTNQILGLVHEKCSPNWVGEWFDVLGLDKQYVFVYNGFISTIVAVVFIFIFLSLTIDVAVRALKLALLRLISPIPIISYMDPKGGKDGAFNSWVKILTSTYLDLFIRLAIIYFILFLIQDMIVHGIVINTTGGIVGGLSVIIIWIAMFIFAKQAPKFIQSIFGIKDGKFSLFGGLKDALAVGSIGMGAVGGAISNVAANWKKNGGKGMENVGKHLLAGITGFAGGGFNAGKSFFTSKENDPKAIMAANRAYNERNYKNASDDSTFGGRMLAGLQGAVGLQNDKQIYDNKIANYKRAEDAWKSVQNALDSDGWKGKDETTHKQHGGFWSSAEWNSSAGDNILEKDKAYSLKQLKDIQSQMKASGRYSRADLAYIDDVVKGAEQSRLDYIRSVSDKNALSETRERQAFEGLTQVLETATSYADDSDGVWADFKGVTSISDPVFMSVNQGGKGFGATFKGASFAAGAAATEIKNSSEYARASSNASRADEKAKK